MQRFGRVLKLRAGAEAEYDRMHAAVWPDVLAALGQAGIQNYSIYRYGQWLFAYYELPDGISLADVGRTFEGNETCARWEEKMHALQEPLPESEKDNWWILMPEVFHWEGRTS